MKSQWCLLLGGTAMIALGIVCGQFETETICAKQMQARDLLAVFGGAICYKSSTTTCGDPPVSCPSHDCDRDTGSGGFSCNKVKGVVDHAFEVQQIQVRNTYVTDNGSMGRNTDPNETKCNQSRQCSCTDEEVPKCKQGTVWMDTGTAVFHHEDPDGIPCPPE